MFHGWRSRLHYWSRRSDAVKKWAVCIVLGGFALSWLLIGLQPPPGTLVMMDPMEQKVRAEWLQLYQAREVLPRQLTQWLREVMPSLPEMAETLEMPVPTWGEFQKSGKLLAYEVQPLLQRHAARPEQTVLWQDYLQVCLSDQKPEAEAAMARVLKSAQSEQPLANELHGSLLQKRGLEAEALAAYRREMRLFPEAEAAAISATRLALKLKELEVLREIEAEGWPARFSPMLEHHVGLEIGDLWMQWRGLFRHRVSHLSLPSLALSLLSALLWYVILVQHMPAQPWRWIWPLLPFVAGILSIWPTVSISAWQAREMASMMKPAFPLDLWHLIMGVGLREELCKLALAAFFMPWLLRRRSSGAALMTGAFVGLGFAFEENLDYFQDYGDGVAMVRFLSANFLHVALTGLLTHALYDMLRSRFARAQEFVSSFVCIVVAHALYDYPQPEFLAILAYLPMLVLAMVAWQFWDQVELEMPHSRQLIAPSAVFLIGTALVIAVSFLMAIAQPAGHGMLIATAMQCVPFLPVTLIYWRRLGH